MEEQSYYQLFNCQIGMVFQSQSLNIKGLLIYLKEMSNQWFLVLGICQIKLTNLLLIVAGPVLAVVKKTAPKNAQTAVRIDAIIHVEEGVEKIVLAAARVVVVRVMGRVLMHVRATVLVLVIPVVQIDDKWDNLIVVLTGV